MTTQLLGLSTEIILSQYAIPTAVSLAGGVVWAHVLESGSVTSLDVKLRSEKGTANCGRMRDAGRIPGVIYGGGGGNVDVSLDAKQLTMAVRKGLANFELQGEVSEKVVLKAVQYDGLGSNVLHVDFVRV